MTASVNKLSNDDGMNKKIDAIRAALVNQGNLDSSNLPSYLTDLFSGDDLSVISQYWKTEYSSRKEGLGDSSGFEGLSCKNYAKWITRFTSRLISLCMRKEKEEHPHSRFTCSLASLNSELSLRQNGSLAETDMEGETPDGFVIFLFRSLLSPECADKVSYLFVHALSFALFYFNGMVDSHDTDSASSTTPRLDQSVVHPFFTKLSDYINSTLGHCDASSDNEMQHCCGDLLAALDTLDSWAMTYEYKGTTTGNSAWQTKGRVLHQFLGMIDRRQVIRVAKLLGQYERAIK